MEAARIRTWLPTLVGGTAALLAWPTLRLGFVHDDRALLEDNARLADLSTLPTALANDLFWLADGVVRPSPYWRPLVTLSYYIDRQVGDGAAWAFHLGNAVAYVLLALVCLRAFGGTVAAALATGVALTHPLFAEPLSNITARTDLCVALFATLALVLPRGWRLLPMALALGCKEVAVLLPGLLFLQERGAGRSIRQSARAVLPSTSLVVAFVALREVLVGGRLAGGPWEGWPAMPARWLHALGRILWPGAGPRPDLDLEHLPTVPTALGLLLALLVLATPFLLAHRTRLATPLATVAWPTLFTAGLVSPGLRYADGFSAWPLVGLGWLLSRLPGRFGLLLVPVLAVCVAGHWGRVQVWESPDSLWSAAYEANPQDPRVQLKTGRVRLADQPRDALRLSEAAWSHPDPRIQREGHELAARALSLIPGSPDSELRHHLQIAADPSDPESGWACGARCVWDEEAEDRWRMCELAVARQAATGDVYNTMGVLRARKRDFEGAHHWFRLAVELEPDRPEFRDNLTKAEKLLRR